MSKERMIPEISRGKQLGIIIAIFLAQFFNNGDTMMMSTATPSILADLGGFEAYSLMFTAKTLTACIGYLIAGKLGDKLGRRLAMQLACLFVLVGYVLSASAGSMEMMIASRAVAGIGAGVGLSLCYIIIGDLFKDRIYARVYIVVTVACSIACIAGGPLGGAITTAFGWSTVFWMLAPLPLISLITISICLPNYVIDAPETRFDTLGCILFVVGATSLILFLSCVGTFAKLTDPSMLICLVVFAVLTVWFFRHEGKIDEERCIFPVHLMRNRRYWVSTIGQFCMSFNSICLISYLPYFIQSDMGQSATTSGYCTSVIYICSAIGNVLIVNALGKNRKYRFWTCFTVLGEAVSLAILLALLSPKLSIALLIGITVLYGTFASAESSVFIMGAQQDIAEARMGIATSGMTFAQSFACVCGSAVGGLCLNLFGTFQSVFAAAAVVTVAAALIVTLLYPRDEVKVHAQS